MIRFVIIEDEPATARNLHYSISQTGHDTLLLITLNSVQAAVEWLPAHPQEYDLLFMDIRLADGLSFGIFDKVQVNSPVIFVTAYDDYTMQAFKSNGIDYILKPFSQHDIVLALDKFKKLTKTAGQEALRALAETLKSACRSYKQSFLVHARDKLIPLPVQDIAWFYTVNEVTYANTCDKRKFIVDFTLEALQQQLDPQSFFRANRQFIVQRKTIAAAEFFFNGRLLLKTEPATEENVLISKAKVPEFKAWMNY